MTQRHISKYLIPLPFIRLGYHALKTAVPTRYPLAARSGDDLFCDKPLFIIGAWRSGTTLLRSMLIAGNNIGIPPEYPILHRLTQKFLMMQHQSWTAICREILQSFISTQEIELWEMSLENLDSQLANIPPHQQSLAKIIDEINFAYVAKHFPQAQMWGDQSPLHTFYFPWIKPIFPNARYLHLLRDGRDVIASNVTSRGHKVPEATAYWKTAIKRVESLKSEENDSQFLEIRYEQLVSEPENTLQIISSFLDIPYTDEMLNYWQTSHAVNYTKFDRHKNLSRPVFTASIGKWKQRLSEEEQQYMLRRIKPELERLGYA
jgi:protein-tyrosine sulfotransferase